jgi:phosphohistidine swiveling domain-containing protein
MLVGPEAVRIARAVARFGGASGDELVLPWYFAPGGDGAAASGAASIARSGAASVRSTAGALMAQAWRTSQGEAGELARSALARLRDQLDPVAAAELESLAPVDPVLAGTVIAAVERAAASAVRDSRLFDAADAWRLAPRHLDQLLDADGTFGKHELQPSAGAWEPFLCAVVVANGQVFSGEPASAGLGAGRLLALGTPQRLPGVRERWILQVNEPLPVFAPLLWGAAGLVSATGSASAHLFDVARTLGVPAVAGVEVSTGCGRAPVVAVDGSAGEVFVL